SVRAEVVLLAEPTLAVEHPDRLPAVGRPLALLDQLPLGGPELVERRPAQGPASPVLVELGELGQRRRARGTRPTVRQDRPPFAVVEDLQQQISVAVTG